MSITFRSSHIAVTAVACLFFLASACGSDEDAPTVTLPAGSVWRYGDHVYTPEQAISQARDSFIGGTTTGEITSMSYVETTMGQARPIFDPNQSSKKEWLTDSPDELTAWAIQAQGSFSHFTMGAEPHNTYFTFQTALVPQGIGGHFSGARFGDDLIDLRALGHVVEVTLPVAEFPLLVRLHEPDLVVHIVIPELGVDTSVLVRTKDADGTMEEPDGPYTVAWYDFTGNPGDGTNIVMAGYTWYDFLGRGVFRGLGELTPGDMIDVSWKDRGSRHYRVISYDGPDPELHADEIVGPTSVETITLIGAYDVTDPPQRIIVRAELVGS